MGALDGGPTRLLAYANAACCGRESIIIPVVDSLRFYTTVNLLLLLLWPLTRYIIDPLLSCFVVLVLSSYMVYVSPRLIYGPVVLRHSDRAHVRYFISGIDLHVFHVCLHVVPLLFLLWLHTRYGAPGFAVHRVLTTVALIFAYFLAVDVYDVYRVPVDRLLVLALIAVLLYASCFLYSYR